MSQGSCCVSCVFYAGAVTTSSCLMSPIPVLSGLLSMPHWPKKYKNIRSIEHLSLNRFPVHPYLPHTLFVWQSQVSYTYVSVSSSTAIDAINGHVFEGIHSVGWVRLGWVCILTIPQPTLSVKYNCFQEGRKPI